MSEPPKQTLEEILDIMTKEANDGMKKFMPDMADRKKIMTDGYMDVNIDSKIDREDTRLRMVLFQFYEGIRAKLSLVPTHVTYIIHAPDKITFRFHILRDGQGNDLFKKTVMKLECAREGRPAELTEEEYNTVFAFYIPSPDDKSGTWHGKPYVKKGSNNPSNK